MADFGGSTMIADTASALQSDQSDPCKATGKAMGDTIEVILDYLRKHHFTKAEAALKEEANARQDGDGGFLPVRDDPDRKLIQHLRSVEEAADTSEVGSGSSRQDSPLSIQESSFSAGHGLDAMGRNLQQVSRSFGHECEHVTKRQQMGINGTILCSRSSGPKTLNEERTSKGLQEEPQRMQQSGGGPEEAVMLWTSSETQLKHSADIFAASDSVGPQESERVLQHEESLQPSMQHLLDKEVGSLGPQRLLEREFSEITNNNKQYQFDEATTIQGKEEMDGRKLHSENRGTCLVQVATMAGDTKEESSWIETGDRGYLQTGFFSNLTAQSTRKDSPIKPYFSNSFINPAVYDDERTLSVPHFGAKSKDTTVRLDLFQHENLVQKTEPDYQETSEGLREELDGHTNEAFAKDTDGVRSVQANHLTKPSIEELPKLPPVRLWSLDKNVHSSKEGSGAGNSTRSFESAVHSLGSTPEGTFGLSAIFELPLNQDLSSLGMKRPSTRPSVSQGIVEDTSKRVSGFATAGERLSESARDYTDDYWDSDAYEDDDDPGYLRQPIEDEVWFLAHEIDYPSEDERARNCSENNLNSYHEFRKFEDDERAFVEEESYFSGEEYYRSKQAGSRVESGREQLTYNDLYDRRKKKETKKKETLILRGLEKSDFSGKLMNSEELNLMRPEIAWMGLVSQRNEYESEGGERVLSDLEKPQAACSVEVDYDCHGSGRSHGVVTSDAAKIGSEVRDNLLGGSSEGDTENFRDQELAVYGTAHSSFNQKSSPHEGLEGKEGRHVEVKSAPVRHLDLEDEEHDMILSFCDEAWGHKKHGVEMEVSDRDDIKQAVIENEIVRSNVQAETIDKVEQDNGGFGFGGFSFPSPSSAGDVVGSRADSGKSPWSTRDSTAQGEDTDEYVNSTIGPDDTLAAWKRKSNESSPIFGSRDENLLTIGLLNCSTVSAHSDDDYVSMEARERMEGQDTGQAEESIEAVIGDDEDGSIQEQIRSLGAEEDEFEVFDLRIIHRKNRTGFEEEKDLPVIINSVVAGRYHVTEYLGSAAFSKAIQAHDLQTGIDVCMKIIKNNKDFFDQSLDEIKLLKFVNKHDPADKYHILRLYDYFYHREHLFIVCELLRANLYEFHKFNRESGGEVYFTMPRLQLITQQCLEALEFLHGLGLIHCDLKPENILVKSYSRCEIKVIDLGSSCFQTDHLCSYVQSRSYRAPEVILGLPYDQKIDIWSLGCILAELCSGNVLFQNDSLTTLLARVIGILGPIDPEMLAKGRDTHKFFTKNHMLYERNQENGQLEYLLPKKTSLNHRLPMGDQGFVEFVGCLLQIKSANRPTAREALQHPWLSYPYEPVSS